MIQDQLVEYISAQTKAGVSRDTIKNTLTTAGWQATDVEETLQKVEATKTSQPITVSPVAAVSAVKPTGPQTIKMSDLISSSDPTTVSASTTTTTTASPAASSSKVFTGSRPAEAKTTATSYTATEFPAKTSSSRGTLITEIILGILVIGIGAMAGYLYFQNNNLSGQLTTLNSASTGDSSQLSTLQASFAASTTNWTSQITTFSGQNKELQTELSFYAVPVNTSSGATSTATVSGFLTGGGKALYVISATYGAKVFVSNSKDASITAEFAPLEASGTVATFSGTYVLGTNDLMVTAVNGNQL